jgi:hypothetical protein
LQLTVAGLLPLQKAGVDDSVQLEPPCDEYVRVTLPPAAGTTRGDSVSVAVSGMVTGGVVLGGDDELGPCSVNVAVEAACVPPALLAMNVNW